MRWFRRRPPAVPPVNARLRFDDGYEVPLELRWIGWDGKCHNWEAVTAVEMNTRLHGYPAVLCDMFPAHTAIHINSTYRPERDQ